MLHEKIGAQLVPPEPHFRWRGGEITRLEGFTDAVFAFAVTLLVVSLEVPHTFAELMTAMKGFVAFAVCFAILVQVWYYHYKFSRRYGLQTTYTIVMTAALIFVVLFYVYPLKFLFTLAVGSLSGGRTAPVEQLGRMVNTYHEISVLWLVYSAGVIAVYVLFALLYQYAYEVLHHGARFRRIEQHAVVDVVMQEKSAIAGEVHVHHLDVRIKPSDIVLT